MANNERYKESYRVNPVALSELISSVLRVPPDTDAVTVRGIRFSRINDILRTFYSRPDWRRVQIVYPSYEELMTGNTLSPMTADDVRIFDRLWTGGHRKTGPFGYPWEDLVRFYNCKITPRSLFEAKPWEIAVQFARVIRDRINLVAPRDSHNYLRVADLGTGSGTMAVALAQPFERMPEVHVTSVESDKTILSYTAHNFRELFARRIELVRMNAVSFLDTVPKDAFSAVFMDPPWRGRKYSGNFNLNDLYFESELGDEVYASQLVERALSIAPVVALHVPPEIEKDLLSFKEGIRGELIHNFARSGGRQLHEVLALFTHKGSQ